MTSRAQVLARGPFSWNRRNCLRASQPFVQRASLLSLSSSSQNRQPNLLFVACIKKTTSQILIISQPVHFGRQNDMELLTYMYGISLASLTSLGLTGKRLIPPAFCHSAKVRDLKEVIPVAPRFLPDFFFASCSFIFFHCSLEIPLR